MNNTLSIKEIFQWFPCSYFESKRDTDDRKFLPTEFFLNFLFRWTGSYQNYIWTMRNNGPLFICFILFVSLFTWLLLFKEKVVLLLILSGYALSMGNNIDIVIVQRETTHNKILPWASHILRTYHLFYYFSNLIYALSIRFISWFKR